MITSNYKRLAATLLQSSASLSAHIPVKATTGQQYYLMEAYPEFPYKRTTTLSLSPITAGIVIGKDITDAKETDIALGDMITSGVNASVTSQELGMDDAGTPWIRFNITVTNQSGGTMIINEVGYQQTISVGIAPGVTSATTAVFLLDRTVLDVPLQLEDGDAGSIQYTLKTAYSPETKTVAGVKMVDFYFGTDEEVAAVIDAAQEGKIDLQEDAGWSIGDTRLIDVAAFTGGNNVNCPAQKIPIAISHFGDYNGAGSVMQFDFSSELSSNFRMNPSNTNAGGYGATEMYNTTLPALALALPAWLRARLKEFDVKAAASGTSSTIETVSGNRLALRSEVEITGENAGSYEGEGAQVELYKLASRRIKTQGMTGSANAWWLRSPTSGNSSGFRCINNLGAPDYYSANTARGVAPFGCL